MKWYKAATYLNEIEAVEVEKETPQFVTVKTSWGSNRTKKQGTSTSYFPTWKAAQEWLIQRHQRDAASHRRSMEYYQQRVTVAEALVEPASPQSTAASSDLE